SVIRVLVCPSSSATVLRSTPRLTASVANRCRRPYSLQSSRSPARSRSRTMRQARLHRSHGLPLALTKTCPPPAGASPGGTPPGHLAPEPPVPPPPPPPLPHPQPHPGLEHHAVAAPQRPHPADYFLQGHRPPGQPPGQKRRRGHGLPLPLEPRQQPHH